VEQAVEIMRQAWQRSHQKEMDAWNAHLEQRRDEGSQNGIEPEIAPRTTPPTTDEIPDWVNRPTPSFLDIKPARHVLKKLEKKEFVELWHFTAQGCREAAAIDLATPDDTFNFLKTENGVVLQTAGASSVSPKVVKDERLSWDQWSEGKTRLLDCMAGCGWNKHEVLELGRFFLGLDLHPIRSQEYGLQAVLRYQENVRRDWFTAVRQGNPYGIGTISLDLLREYQRMVGIEIQAVNNVSGLIRRICFPNYQY